MKSDLTRAFLERYEYYFHQLYQSQESFYRAIKADHNKIIIDYTVVKPIGFFIRASERARYVRTKTLAHMLKPFDATLSASTVICTLPQVRAMYEMEARQLGISNFPTKRVLAACLAGYFDLPEDIRLELHQYSKVFKVVEEEHWSHNKVLSDQGTWYAEWTSTLPFAHSFPEPSNQAEY